MRCITGINTMWKCLLPGIFWISVGGSANEDTQWMPSVVADNQLGDLSEMRELRRIRALVTFNKTDFFLWKGAPRGFEAELLQRYEVFLNQGVERESDRTRVVFVPVAFDDLIPSLLAGKGDLIAAGLTITDERKLHIDFTRPYLPNVDEVVVGNSQETPLYSVEDLAGRSVYVLRGSSYAQHLKTLSARLSSAGLAPINIVEADENLSDTDILELVNAGIVELTVIDNHLARLWSRVYHNLAVNDYLKINEGGQIGWAIRPQNPDLRDSLNAFLKDSKKGTWLGNILFERYFKNEYFAKNPLTDQVWKRLHRYAPMFQHFGEQYDLNWLAIAAQAYQESGFDHSLVSNRGAVGIMQILPSTAADASVGIENVKPIENNVHAAVKYLAYLRDQYFSDEKIPESHRLGFMWAAYNAGPEKVRTMRRRATQLGLDPNRWFGHVEHVAQSVAGPETVRHVANVYKYYVAYRLSEELLKRRAVEMEAISQGGTQ